MTIHLSDIDAHTPIKPVFNHTLLNKDERRPECWYLRLAKRVFDVTAVVVSLPIVLPVVLVLALLVALNGGQPFYRQMRVGKDGRKFQIWKLRTMVPDAKEKLDSFLAEHPEARAEWDNLQKLKHDPRITPLGRVLRKLSLDELPQLFNVLNGTMSLVGPRPMMPEQQVYYPGRSYYALRPGITGLWQISDRNNCEFADRAKFDDDYYKTVSLMTDFRVLFSTIFVVIRGTGY